MLPDDLELVCFRDDGQAAPGAMQLADAIDVFNHALLAIVAGVLALHVDNSDALSYLVKTLALLLCLVHLSLF